MGIEQNTNPLFARYPELGKLTLALLEHVVGPVLGKDAIKIIGAPSVNKRLYDKLCHILALVEKRLIATSPSNHLASGLLQLQIANLETTQRSFWKFVQNPANPDFPLALYNQLCLDYPHVTDAERVFVVDTYVKMLKSELIGIDDDIRQRVAAAALLEIQNNVEKMVNTLEAINVGVQTIAQNLSMIDPPPVRRAVTKSITQLSTRKILIIFSSSFDKDTRLAEILYSHLVVRFDVTKQDLLLAYDEPGWAEKLSQAVEFSDLVIPVISEGVSSHEQLIFELNATYHIQNVQGKPLIIPIRFQYLKPYPYPLSRYLAEIPCIVVEKLDITAIQNLTFEIDKVLSGEPYGELFRQPELPAPALPRPTPSIDPYDYSSVDNPKGTMSKESRFYIQRPQDNLLLGQIELPQVLINIKAPRQMGKSSMLVRGVERARQAGKKIVYLDFQQLDTEHLRDSNTFYTTFCNWVAGNLNLNIEAERFWKSPGSNNIKCTKFFQEILTTLNQPLLVAIDEVDRLLGSPFRSDFFGLLRSWHIDRQSSVMSLLSMALVISTEPILLIDDIASPFNVGENLDLDDFTPEQVEELNFRHGLPFGESELIHLMTLVGGHPYLIRQAMYKVSMHEIPAEKLLTNASSEIGPFSDHLIHHLFRLNRSKELRQAMLQIVKEHVSPSDELTYRLKAAGLVRQRGRSVLPRYGIYADYFQVHLKGA